ncbi:MAG: hypothetical protein ACREHD_11365, partial [Pirellulales bacterium]
GLGLNNAAVIYVLGAQPVLLNNVIENFSGAAISIDATSLSATLVPDWGRSTGSLDAYQAVNYGPLVRENKIAATLGANAVNGMLIRGGTLTASSIWDDTDIVHVLAASPGNPTVAVTVPNNITLALESTTTQSLVVKLLGSTAGINASGSPTDVTGRIGGSLQVLGQPGHPVIMTSLNDQTVGAGLRPDDTPQNDTANSGSTGSGPKPGDWNSVTIDEYASDNNFAVVNETEPAYTGGNDTNGSLGTNPTAQPLGTLAPNLQSSDNNNRLGFQVNGTISLNDPHDVDIYSFQAQPGTQAWIDVSNTSHALDAVMELVDRNGNVLARSDSSLLEQDSAI